jgi:hypothetical protein
MPGISRRHALRGGVGLLAVGFAGCSGDEGDSPADENESTSDGDDEGTGDDTESLVVDESYTNGIGNTLTVTDIALQDTVEAERRLGDGELYDKEPEEGEQWAVITVEVTNDSGETHYLTPPMEIELRANGTEYTNTAIKNEEDVYSAEEVQDGESRAGWMVYGIPAELTLADIAVVHSNSADGESWTVTWSAE